MSIAIREDDHDFDDYRPFNAMKAWVASRGDAAQQIVDEFIQINNGELLGYMLLPVVVLGDLALNGHAIGWSLIDWKNVETDSGSGWSKTDVFSMFNDPRWLGVSGEFNTFSKGLLRNKLQTSTIIYFCDVKQSLMPKDELRGSLLHTASLMETVPGLKSDVF